jgi:hypothetical protein
MDKGQPHFGRDHNFITMPIDLKFVQRDQQSHWKQNGVLSSTMLPNFVVAIGL